jgi:hypothetical protein
MKSTATPKVHIMEIDRDPLKLKSLPPIEAPVDDWPLIEAALRRDRRRAKLLRYAGGALATAATVTLAVGLTLRPGPSKPGDTGPEGTEPAMAQQQSIPESGRTAISASPRPDTPQNAQTLESMLALSQQLETRLRMIRSGIGGLPTHALVYQVELEDLIVQVDDELSMRPDSLDLWSQRVNLLLDLNQLYEKELRRERHQMASL